MRIGVDLTETAADTRTGSTYFSMELVRALLALNESDDHAYSFYGRLSRRLKAGPFLVPPGHCLRWYQEPWWPLSPRLDVVHAFGFRVPAWPRCARVATVFDVIPLLDSSREWVSEHFRAKRAAQYGRLAADADVLIAISEATRRDFLKFFPYPAERIRVIPGGVHTRFAPEQAARAAALLSRHQLQAGYLLFIGAVSPRKNVANLLRAYAGSRAARDRMLVIAGALGKEAGPIVEQARREGLSARVRFIGYVPDPDLPALYAASHALLFPTFYEGFGMPILEAMASGTAVLVGNRGAATEVAGGHAVVTDPYDVDNMTRGIDAVIDVSREQREAARQYATAFTWENSARATLEAYAWAVQHRRKERASR